MARATVGAMPQFDVVVVSYNSEDVLRGCVEQLAGARDIDVIVVDNASRDGSLDPSPSCRRVSPSTRISALRTGATGAGRQGRRLRYCSSIPMRGSSRRQCAAWPRCCEQAEAGLVAPQIVDEAGDARLFGPTFPRLRSTYVQAFSPACLLPTLMERRGGSRRRRVQMARASTGCRGLRPRPPLGTRTDRRLGRRVLPLRRGRRPLPTAAGGRMGSLVRAERPGGTRRRSVGAESPADTDPGGEPNPLRAAARGRDSRRTAARRRRARRTESPILVHERTGHAAGTDGR